jgi:hypothetical protein
VTDPQAVPNAQKAWPDLQYADSAAVAAKDVDLVLLLTEWDETGTWTRSSSGRSSLASGSSTAGMRSILRSGGPLAGRTARWVESEAGLTLSRAAPVVADC